MRRAIVASIIGSIGLIVPAPDAVAAPANGLLAFSRYAANFGIGTVRPDGTNLTKLTSTFDFSPAWSPDGTKIAFVRSISARRTALFLMRPDATHQHRIYTYVSRGCRCGDFITGLDWSPDGDWIALTWVGPSRNEIWAIHPDGSRLTHLTDGIKGSQEWPAWSPDGTQIAFEGSRVSGYIGIFTVGTSKKTVVYHDYAARSPDWVDATHLVFSGVDRDACPDCDIELLTIATDGTGLTAITNSSAAESEPEVSPDATMVAYVRGTDLFVQPIAGGRRTRLTNSDVLEQFPAWQPIP
jgi:Tol biopolymer transport system component